jgi:hypothetical protein
LPSRLGFTRQNPERHGRHAERPRECRHPAAGEVPEFKPVFQPKLDADGIDEKRRRREDDETYADLLEPCIQ